MQTTNEDLGAVAADTRDAAVASAREAVLRLARDHGFLTGHLCGCGRPTCRNDSAETASLVLLLRAASTEWREAPDPATQVELRERLLAFARVFGLDVCPAGDPDCHCGRLGQLDARGVLRTVADVWHGRAGNPGAGGEDGTPIDAETVMAMAEDHAHNLRVLDGLALALDPSRTLALNEVVQHARTADRGAWFEEAEAMAAEALASWVPEADLLPEFRRVLASAQAVAFHAGWPTEHAVSLDRAAASASRAVLVRGIADPSVTDALFGPLAPHVSLPDLDAFADVEFLAT